MTTTIETLTPEQEAQIPPVLAHWTREGMRTDDADFDACMPHIDATYGILQKPAPQARFLSDSPLSGAIQESICVRVEAAIAKGEHSKISATSPFDDISVAEAFVEKLQLGKGALRRILDQIIQHTKQFSKPGTSLDVSEAEMPVFERLLFRVTRLWGEEEPRNEIFSMLNSAVSGAWWQGWLGFAHYCRDVLKLPEANVITPIKGLAENGGWFSLREDGAFLQHRPTRISVDEQGEPHSEDGPALAYRDGLALWQWHGVEVPKLVIESPDQITADWIGKQNNNEVQRIARERMGDERFIRETGCFERDRAMFPVDMLDGGKGELLHLFLESPKEAWNYVVAPDGSTGRSYYLHIPKEITNVRDGLQWLNTQDPKFCISQG